MPTRKPRSLRPLGSRHPGFHRRRSGDMEGLIALLRDRPVSGWVDKQRLLIEGSNAPGSIRSLDVPMEIDPNGRGLWISDGRVIQPADEESGIDPASAFSVSTTR